MDPHTGRIDRHVFDAETYIRLRYRRRLTLQEIIADQDNEEKENDVRGSE